MCIENEVVDLITKRRESRSIVSNATQHATTELILLPPIRDCASVRVRAARQVEAKPRDASPDLDRCDPFFLVLGLVSVQLSEFTIYDFRCFCGTVLTHTVGRDLSLCRLVGKGATVFCELDPGSREMQSLVSGFPTATTHTIVFGPFFDTSLLLLLDLNIISTLLLPNVTSDNS